MNRRPICSGKCCRSIKPPVYTNRATVSRETPEDVIQNPAPRPTTTAATSWTAGTKRSQASLALEWDWCVRALERRGAWPVGEPDNLRRWSLTPRRRSGRRSRFRVGNPLAPLPKALLQADQEVAQPPPRTGADPEFEQALGAGEQSEIAGLHQRILLPAKVPKSAVNGRGFGVLRLSAAA